MSVALLEGGLRLYERAFLIHTADASDGVYDLILFDYNDHQGFLERERAPGEFRILSFGDSFAESVTLPQYSYASVLERKLGDAREAGPVRVVNFGRNGTSFHDYARQIALWRERVEFDAVLVNLYAGNDFKDMQGIVHVDTADPRYRGGAGGTRFVYGPGVDIPRRHPARVLDYAYAFYYTSRYQPAAGQDAALYQRRALQYPQDVYVATQASQVGVYQQAAMADYTDAYAWLYKLMSVVAELEQAGVAVVITLAPPHFAVDPALRASVLAEAGVEEDALDFDLPAQVTLAFARAAGVDAPVLDLTACLREGIAAGEAVYWGTNTHWSIRGNALVGERLAQALGPMWLGVKVPGPQCALAPGRPSEAVARGSARALASIRDQLAFETSVLAPLLGGRFEDRSALEAALAQAGFAAAPQRLLGAYWGDAPKPGDEFVRPHGLKRFIRPHGYLVDRAAPGTASFVAFLHRGELIGVARTHAPAPDGLPGVAAGQPNALYTALIRQPVRGSSHEPGLWVVALTTNGAYAFLEEAAPPVGAETRTP